MSKLTLRAANEDDIARAAEFRRSLRGWSQDSMFLATAIVYNDFLALQSVIHAQREELKRLRGEAQPVRETPLVRKLKRLVAEPAPDVLAEIRARPRST